MNRMPTTAPRASHIPVWLGILALTAVACEPRSSPADRVVDAAIERHGGTRFGNSVIRFTFRGIPFEVLRDDGRFRYQRTVIDSIGGVTTVEVMENEGTWIERDGTRIELDSAGLYEVETAVNSVVYFGFLPFRLDDEVVIATHLGEDEISSEPYEEIEVVFPQEGGGTDWDTRFVFWIHRDQHTLDYMAYRYARDGGGTRFRRAVNRREVGGLVIQDYENYAAEQDIDDLAEYDRLFEEGGLELVSMIELEDVSVERADEREDIEGGDQQSGDLASASIPPDEGLELLVGFDQTSYGPGSSIELVMHLQNRATATRTLTFPTAQRYEVIMTDSSGGEVYRWSVERTFAQSVGEITLAPGDSVRFQETIAAPSIAGSYELGARIPAEGADLGVSLPIRVEP